MKLIVGLGNYGLNYAHTRHNIGWDAISDLAASLGASFVEKTRFQAEVAEGQIEGEKVLLVHPLTYMNLSGEALRSLIQFYHVPLTDVLIVQDEMDYPLGQLSFCAEGGPAGHNGIVSVQTCLGTTKVQRLRLGIDRPEGPLSNEDYVLQPFSLDEKKLVAAVVLETTQAIRDWSAQGIERAMNTWNGRSSASSS